MPKTTSDQAVAGFAIAAFFLSVYSIADSVKRGGRTLNEGLDLISQARALLRVPGSTPDAAAAKFADEALEQALSVVAALASRMPPQPQGGRPN